VSIIVEGTVIGLRSDEKQDNAGEPFTVFTVDVYGGGDFPHYLDLPRGFDRASLPGAGEPIRCAVSVRPYVSKSARSGAGYALTLRALLPMAGGQPVAEAVVLSPVGAQAPASKLHSA
jgi:hypothetical protein